MAAYFDKRAAAISDIEEMLRKIILERCNDQPISVVREGMEEIKFCNSVVVNRIVKYHDCDLYSFKWKIFFDYKIDENNVARVCGCSVVVVN